MYYKAERPNFVGVISLMSDYHTKSIADLKAILSSRGLKTTGTKVSLIWNSLY